MKVSYCTLNMRQAAVQRPSTESLFYQFWGIPRKKTLRVLFSEEATLLRSLLITAPTADVLLEMFQNIQSSYF